MYYITSHVRPTTVVQGLIQCIEATSIPSGCSNQIYVLSLLTATVVRIDCGMTYFITALGNKSNSYVQSIEGSYIYGNALLL